MKILVNNCYGGFSVTEAVYKELGFEWDGYGNLGNEWFGLEDEDQAGNYYAFRSNPKLIAAVEKIGLEASSERFAGLRIADVPDDVDWDISEYDGIETVNEVHRSW